MIKNKLGDNMQTAKAQYQATCLGYVASVFLLIPIIHSNNVPNNFYLIFASCMAVITSVYGVVLFLVDANSTSLSDRINITEVLVGFVWVFIFGLNLIVHIDFCVHFIVIYFAELFF